jgi:hypothetical protein
MRSRMRVSAVAGSLIVSSIVASMGPMGPAAAQGRRSVKAEAAVKNGDRGRYEPSVPYWAPAS